MEFESIDDVSPRVAKMIVAYEDGSGLIGDGPSGLPWSHSEDLKRFKKLTTHSPIGGQNKVIISKKSCLGIPETVLKESEQRRFVRLSKSGDEGTYQIKDIEHLIDDDTWIAGGAEIYSQLLSYVKFAFVTRIKKDTCKSVSSPVYLNVESRPWDVEGQTEWINRRRFKCKSNNVLTFEIWENVSQKTSPLDRIKFSSPALIKTNSHPEYQYLEIINSVIRNGMVQTNRTGMNTRVQAGRTLRYPLLDKRRGPILPVLTSKRVFKPEDGLKGSNVLKELIWFLTGSTDSKVLTGSGCKIWDDNGSRDFLDSRGLTTYAEGELGPVYGYQWRSFGKPFAVGGDGHPIDIGPGDPVCVDQISKLIHMLKTNPHSRRHLVVAFNPNQLHQMALPPCHFAFEVVVVDGWLSMHVMMRSADLGLGVPYNLMSYGLLAHALAKLCGYRALEITIHMVNCHVYEDHIGPLLEQLHRPLHALPSISFSGIELICTDDVSKLISILQGIDLSSEYKHESFLRMKMAV